MRGWGWAGTVAEFIETDLDDLLAALGEHHRQLMSQQPSGSQRDAWVETHEVVASALTDWTKDAPGVTGWGVVQLLDSHQSHEPCSLVQRRSRP